MINVFETQNGVTRKVYPLPVIDQDTLPTTVEYRVLVQEQKYIESKATQLVLVWDTILLQFVAHIPYRTTKEQVVASLLDMFAQLNCDLTIEVLWEEETNANNTTHS